MGGVLRQECVCVEGAESVEISYLVVACDTSKALCLLGPATNVRTHKGHRLPYIPQPHSLQATHAGGRH